MVRSDSDKKCFCAFCKHERFIYRKKHINWINGVLCALSSALIMFLFWQEFDARVFFIFSLSIIVAEAFIVLRWRVSLSCPFCGFDPVLYIKSPSRAVEKVKLSMESFRQRPDYLLRAKNPKTNLARQPKRSIKDEVKERNAKKMIDRALQLQHESDPSTSSLREGMSSGIGLPKEGQRDI